MELEKFDPVCAAVLKKTEIEKPAYPVIDFHMHMGKMLLGWVNAIEASWATCLSTSDITRIFQRLTSCSMFLP